VAPAPSGPQRDLEQARLIEGEINRSLTYADDEIGRNPGNAVSYLDRVNNRLGSDAAKQHLDPATVARVRARVAELQAKIEAGQREERVRRIEEQITRFTRQAEEDLSWNADQAARMIEHATEKLQSEEARQHLSPDAVARFRAEIARVQQKMGAQGKSAALERATPILEELEERDSDELFEGMDEPEAYRANSEVDSLRQRVRAAISELPGDDPEVQSIGDRLAAVDGRIAAASARWARDQAAGKLRRSWESVAEEISGWDDESQDEGEAILPKTVRGIRQLQYFLGDTGLAQIRSDHAGDDAIQAIFAEAEQALESATEKLHAAFSAILEELEAQPRPRDKYAFERALRVAGSADSIFEGTRHHRDNAARAKRLDEKWQAEIAAEEAARKALYERLAAEASAAWPGIVSAIQAEEGFDPGDPGSRGKTIRLSGVFNRSGWDFDGNQYDFAIWVNGTPLAGNFATHVRQKFDEVGSRTGFIDDHAPWDAVVVVVGPGKVSKRSTITVKNSSNLEVGKLEEWRPVDCVQCKVIALRAGPVAIGPA
jgi:hypothetical protein